MTSEEAIQQIKEAIEARGKITAGNVADSILGVASQNKEQLQDLLNKFLEKKGLISVDDEAALKKLLDKQKEERKIRTKIIVRNVTIAVGTIVLGTAFWFTFKNRKR